MATLYTPASLSTILPTYARLITFSTADLQARQITRGPQHRSSPRLRRHQDAFGQHYADITTILAARGITT